MKKRTAFNLEESTLRRLDDTPKSIIRNRSELVDRLLNQYLDTIVDEDGNFLRIGYKNVL